MTDPFRVLCGGKTERPHVPPGTDILARRPPAPRLLRHEPSSPHGPVPVTPARVAHAREFGRPAELVFPARTLELDAICLYSNALPELQRSWRPAYQARTAQAAEVLLVRLPPGTQVSGRAGFATRCGEHFLVEQNNPDDVAALETLERRFPQAPPDEQVDAECMLIARYGEGTWGHWVVELLPKVAVCENAWPGRFRYGMPDWVLAGGPFRERILESLATYGVGEDRLVRLRSDRTYGFGRLHVLTPVYTSYVPHPDVAAVVRRTARNIPSDDPTLGKLALLRSDPRRGINNGEAVRAALEEHRFAVANVGEQGFAQQVQMFRSARTIFSVLGSSLAGLLYARPGTRVIAAAPMEFGDRFFYGILQSSPGAWWAEVRGPVRVRDDRHYRDSAFDVPVPQLRAALAALGV